MESKLCSECGEVAQVALCQMVSSLGHSPRKQRVGKSTAFCAPCLQSRIRLQRRLGLHSIQKPLDEALTALAEDCGFKLSRPRTPTQRRRRKDAFDGSELQALSNSLQLEYPIRK
jgi:hypothetical protein